MKSTTRTGGLKVIKHTGKEEYSPDERNIEIEKTYRELDRKKAFRKKVMFYIVLSAFLMYLLYSVLQNTDLGIATKTLDYWQ